MTSEINNESSDNILNYLIDFFTISIINTLSIPKHILLYFFKGIEVMDYIYQPDIDQILLDKENKTLKNDKQLIPFISIDTYIKFEKILFKENAQYPFLIFDFFLLSGISSSFISIIHIFIDKNNDSNIIFLISNLTFLFFLYIFFIVFLSSGKYFTGIIYFIISFIIYYFFFDKIILNCLMFSISILTYYFLGSVSRCYSFKNIGKEKITFIYNSMRFIINFFLFILISFPKFKTNKIDKYLIGFLIIFLSLIELFFYKKIIKSRGIFVRDEYYKVMKGILLDDKYKEDLIERKVMSTISYLNVSIVEFIRNEIWQCLIYIFSIFPLIYFKFKSGNENNYYELETIKCCSFILMKLILFIQNLFQDFLL